MKRLKGKQSIGKGSFCNLGMFEKYLALGLFGDFLFYELKLKLGGKGFANKNFSSNFDFHRSHSQLNGLVFLNLQVG